MGFIQNKKVFLYKKLIDKSYSIIRIMIFVCLFDPHKFLIQKEFNFKIRSK